MHANVRGYEPREALFVPDDDALRFYRAIARAGRRMLRPGGKLYFEIYERAAGRCASCSARRDIRTPRCAKISTENPAWYAAG